jgi:hypothetical protein
MTRARLLRLIEEWALNPSVAPRARCLPPGFDAGPEWEWLPESARRSGTGIALVSLPDGRQAAIAPPFPFEAAGEGMQCLRDHLTGARTVGIILLRLGHYAVGVGDDEALLVPKAGHRYVHGRHKAGGQSQHRFEHNREQWVRELYDEVCEVAASRFREFGRPLDWLALGGDRFVVGGFRARCESLAGLRDRVLPWRIPVDRPGADALRGAVAAVWSSRLYERAA